MNFSAQRSCPSCGAKLEKKAPDDIVRCGCGWLWR